MFLDGLCWLLRRALDQTDVTLAQQYITCRLVGGLGAGFWATAPCGLSFGLRYSKVISVDARNVGLLLTVREGDGVDDIGLAIITPDKASK